MTCPQRKHHHQFVYWGLHQRVAVCHRLCWYASASVGGLQKISSRISMNHLFQHILGGFHRFHHESSISAHLGGFHRFHVQRGPTQARGGGTRPEARLSGLCGCTAGLKDAKVVLQPSYPLKRLLKGSICQVSITSRELLIKKLRP